MLASAENHSSRSSQKPIGSVDPHALKNLRPKGGIYQLTENALSPVQAEPGHVALHRFENGLSYSFRAAVDENFSDSLGEVLRIRRC
jgi:hypothetical protein